MLLSNNKTALNKFLPTLSTFVSFRIPWNRCISASSFYCFHCACARAHALTAAVVCTYSAALPRSLARLLTRNIYGPKCDACWPMKVADYQLVMGVFGCTAGKAEHSPIIKHHFFKFKDSRTARVGLASWAGHTQKIFYSTLLLRIFLRTFILLTSANSAITERKIERKKITLTTTAATT